MSFANLGDLSASVSMRRQNVSLRQEIERLSKELTTGQVSDFRDVLAGSFSSITDIERRVSILDGFRVATAEATIYASNAQLALGNFQNFGGDLASSLITAGTSPTSVSGADTVAEAENALIGMVGAVNTRVAGRYLFSGTATDQAPLPPAQVILDELRLALTGATAPADVIAAADAWFSDPLGFEAIIYQGSTNQLSPIALSPSESVALDVKAIDPKKLETIKLTAVAALADDSAFSFDISSQGDLFSRLGQSLLVGQDEVITLRADIGFVEARIEGIVARNEAELTSLGFAKANLLEVDPFETATKLEEAQFQLQSLYSVTVRNSHLSLANFL